MAVRSTIHVGPTTSVDVQKRTSMARSDQRHGDRYRDQFPTQHAGHVVDIQNETWSGCSICVVVGGVHQRGNCEKILSQSLF